MLGLLTLTGVSTMITDEPYTVRADVTKSGTLQPHYSVLACQFSQLNLSYRDGKGCVGRLI